MKPLPVSCIIPVRGEYAGLSVTLRSLKKQRRPPAEVVVVWDEAKKKPPAIAGQPWPFEVRLVRGPCQGSYAARNRGTRLAKQPWIFFVDTSLALPPGLLEEGAAYMATHDYIAFLVKASPPQRFFQHYTAAYEFQFESWFRRYHFGGIAMIRKAVFERLGGFDERLMSGADHELGRRCYEKGIRQAFIENHPIYHPPRGWWAWLRKSIRIEKGKRQLKTLYPDRFGFYSTGWKAWWDSARRLAYALGAGWRQVPADRVSLPAAHRWALAVMAAMADWMAKTIVGLFPRQKWNI